MIHVVLSKIHLSPPQEVGVGFKKASDTELASRRCAHPPSATSDSVLSFAISFQSKDAA